MDLGWSRQRVLVIDEDLGHSAATTEGRPGFQRLVAEVGLPRLGVRLGEAEAQLVHQRGAEDVGPVEGSAVGGEPGCAFTPSEWDQEALP